jgi:hypothetical protein
MGFDAGEQWALYMSDKGIGKHSEPTWLDSAARKVPEELEEFNSVATPQDSKRDPSDSLPSQA